MLNREAEEWTVASFFKKLLTEQPASGNQHGHTFSMQALYWKLKTEHGFQTSLSVPYFNHLAQDNSAPPEVFPWPPPRGGPIAFS